MSENSLLSKGNEDAATAEAEAQKATEDNASSTVEERAAAFYGKKDDAEKAEGEDADKADAEGEDKAEGEDDKADKGEDKADKEKDAEDYDLADVELELPDGVEIDKDMLGEYTAMAKELKLDKAGAAELLKMGPKLIENFAQKQAEQFQATQQEWVKEVRADNEIGATDEKEFSKKIATAAGLFRKVNPAFLELMDKTGLGNNPEVIRLGYRLGKLVEDDKVVIGANGTVEADPLAKLYPSMVKRD